MVTSRLRYFTYKITFKDLPKYFYYGRHKDNGKPYFGSPRTWRHLWDQFEPEIQILQWFETEDEVITVETKIITATWKDKYSLNEHSGGYFSEESGIRGASVGGKKAMEKKNPSTGKSAHAEKIGRMGGKKVMEEKDENGKSRHAVKISLLANSPESVSKKKESFKRIGHQIGETNSQFGTMWITNGETNKKIKRGSDLPDGFVPGRILK